METSTIESALRPADALALPDSPLLIDLDDARPLAQAIVDTIREPLLVLDQDLRVVTANRAFYQAFRMNCQDIHGRPIYGLGDGQWDIPELRLLLEGVAPQHAAMEAYEVERDFPIIGRRAMLLNARELFFQKNSRKLILLTIEDVTDRRAAEREIADLLQQKETLLQEMQHRVANSLQIIASILSSRRGRCSPRKRGGIFRTRTSGSCRWRLSSNSCWLQAMARRSKSALISVACARRWQPR